MLCLDMYDLVVYVTGLACKVDQAILVSEIRVPQLMDLSKWYLHMDYPFCVRWDWAFSFSHVLKEILIFEILVIALCKKVVI